MLIRDLATCKPFTAGDMSTLKELLNPESDDIEAAYSLAHATVEPGRTTLKHSLSASEVYFVLKGQGQVRLGNRSRRVRPGQAVYIPPNELQQITNTGSTDLEFLCIVSPAWKPEYEKIIHG